jgi:integrating conjugative element protein (TIGR03756 family)
MRFLMINRHLFLYTAVCRWVCRRVYGLARVLAELVFFGLMSTTLPAWATTAPPGHISAFGVAMATAAHMGEYTHFEIIGACFWLQYHEGTPKVVTTLELDEYLPDLLVTSFNGQGDDPFLSASITLDTVAQASGNALGKSITGFGLGNGRVPVSADTQQKANGLITKYVDVIGNPYPLSYLPFPHLKPDTTPFMPYYASAADIPGRLGLTEVLHPESLDVFGYYIGQGFTDKWGYEFPRSMTSQTSNDYEAAVMAAQRAADIVTNRNALHVVRSVTDRCGINCAVANVIEESPDSNESSHTSDTHEIWQEVYPLDRHIRPGASPSFVPGKSLGEADEAAGNGNYVFVLWRHYRGCVQTHGQFLFATMSVSPTQKR